MPPEKKNKTATTMAFCVWVAFSRQSVRIKWFDTLIALSIQIEWNGHEKKTNMKKTNFCKFSYLIFMRITFSKLQPFFLSCTFHPVGFILIICFLFCCRDRSHSILSFSVRMFFLLVSLKPNKVRKMMVAAAVAMVVHICYFAKEQFDLVIRLLQSEAL